MVELMATEAQRSLPLVEMVSLIYCVRHWIPAFAGMTVTFESSVISVSLWPTTHLET